MLTKALTALTLISIATPAMARPHHGGHGNHARPHHGPSTYVIDNDYVDTVQVDIDGAHVGTVRPGDDQAFRIRPGRHTVTVSTLDGYVLRSDSDRLRPREVDRVPVYNPSVPLTVSNRGHQPLFVEGVQGGHWVQAGRSMTVDVPAGKWELNASVRRHGRMVSVDCQAIYARPGHRNKLVFNYAPPPPTRLVLQNLEPRPVSVYIDNEHYGTLGSGQVFTVNVRPGNHSLAAYSARGGVVYHGRVTAGREADTRVDFIRSRPRRPAGHQTAQHRPSRPPR